MNQSDAVQIKQNNISSIVRAMLSLHNDDIGCQDCFDQVDHFADMVASGQDAASIFPLVQRHLELCPPCREEFQALLSALKALE